MEDYYRYGTSNSHPPPFYIGASSKATFSNLKINSPQKDLETTCPNGSRHVSKKRVQLTHDQKDEHESKCARVAELTTNDPKQLKRIANRLSAQRSRQRKQEYKTMLEEKVKCLEENITVLTNKKEAMTNKNNLLQFEKNILDQKMYHLALKSKIREMKIEKTKAEIIKIMERRNLRRPENVDEPDLTLTLGLPGIHTNK